MCHRAPLHDSYFTQMGDIVRELRCLSCRTAVSMRLVIAHGRVGSAPKDNGPQVNRWGTAVVVGSCHTVQRWGRGANDGSTGAQFACFALQKACTARAGKSGVLDG
jgi:hypothetical protein